MALQAFRSMNASFRALIETTSGTENAPAAANAIRTRGNVRYSVNMDMIQAGYAQESVSAAAPVPGGASAGFQVSCWMTGTSAPGTAGPDWATLLRICAYGETITSAEVTGTSQAIGANSITLAAGASSTDNLYRGMPIDGTSGSCNGQRRWISAYNGTTKVATITPAWGGAQSGTPTYSIPKNALYTPITQGQKTATCYAYQHDSVAGNTSRLTKVFGAMGNYQIGITPGGNVGIDFSLSGLFPAAPTDVSAPAAAAPVGLAPQAFLGASCYLDDVALQLASATLSSGNTLGQFPDPSQTYGRDISEVVSRTVTGRLVGSDLHIATRDAFADMVAATTRKLILAWGSGAGRKLSILYPAIQYTGSEQEAVSGFEADGMPFQATGLDSEVFICVAE